MTRTWGTATGLAGCIALAIALAGCLGDDDDDDGGGDGGSDIDANTGGGEAFAPDGLASGALIVNEDGGATNTWLFPAGDGNGGMATLMGTGEFPFSYAKTGDSASLLEFEVGGKDSYAMTWTSDDGGTFMESFDGVPGFPGTFTFTVR